MSNEEFYGMTNDELYDFVEKCIIENSDTNLLQIKSTNDANTFYKICKKFIGASIMGFSYANGNSSPHFLFKRINNIILKLGANVFLPDLRCGETYDYSINMVFEDVIDFSFIPCANGKHIEIDIDTFTVENECCIFSCYLKNDKTKKLFIKSKKLFIDNFINPKDDEEEVSTEPESVIDRAKFMFKQKNYTECIRILKYEYSDLEKNAEANNILALCFSEQNNFYEAIHYINNAIELEPKRCVYFYNKAFYLYRSNLLLDALKCFNVGLKLTKREDDKRLITKSIIDLVNIKMRSYTVYEIKDENSFCEYLYYFDSIINLEYCFPEFREKFKQYKKEAISYFYNNQKKHMDNPFCIAPDYSNLAKNFETILKIEGLEEKIKNGAQKYLDDCNDILKKEQIKVKVL